MLKTGIRPGVVPDPDKEAALRAAAAQQVSTSLRPTAAPPATPPSPAAPGAQASTAGQAPNINNPTPQPKTSSLPSAMASQSLPTTPGPKQLPTPGGISVGPPPGGAQPPPQNVPTSSLAVNPPTGSAPGKQGIRDFENKTDPPPGANAPTSTDDLVDAFVRKQLSGDTKDQEALIRQLEQEDLGKQLVSRRASMGRAGFGASGALAGMEADERQQAAHKAAQDIFGARQQATDNATKAAQLDIQERQAAADQARQSMMDKALASVIGGSDAAGAQQDAVAGVSGGTGADNDPLGGIGGASQSDLQSLAASGVTFKAPPGGNEIQTGAVNGEKYVYVVGSDGNYYKFKVPGSGLGHTPSDAEAQAWFNKTFDQAAKKKGGG